MNHYLIAAAVVVLSYLIGAIPFGYVIFHWARGIDIRTVGSGNIGATNVGRQLGFRFFVIVFLLDMAKGFLPTWAFPRVVAALTGRSIGDIAVLAALASILGHNFPIYLKFRGGKGVATSFGALLALNWAASLASVAAFVVSLLITRYVSVSSLTGGLIFMLAYFHQEPHPWSPEHRAMTLLTFGLVGLLAVRHRKNLARIAAGTEPKVSFRKKKNGSAPSGRSSCVYLVVIAGLALGGGVWIALTASRKPVLELGGYAMTEVARTGTGYQRADRVAFADAGRLLAVTCPRYNRLVLYRITKDEQLEMAHDVALEGHPVALRVAGDRLFLLERPPGDDRHVKPGWWETFDLKGQRVGARHPVDYYPDDFAMTPDGRHLLMLCSGRAEGDADKPLPALSIVELGSDPKTVGRLTFEKQGDDPGRITLSNSGQYAAVTLHGSNESAAIDLFDPTQPRLIGRTPLANAEVPYPSVSAEDTILMPVSDPSEAVWLTGLDLDGFGGSGLVASILPHGSGLRIDLGKPSRLLGRLAVRGPMNLGKTRPMGLAYAPERGLIAMSNRSGSVHLVALRPVAGRSAQDRLARADTRPLR